MFHDSAARTCVRAKVFGVKMFGVKMFGVKMFGVKVFGVVKKCVRINT